MNKENINFLKIFCHVKNVSTAYLFLINKLCKPKELLNFF